MTALVSAGLQGLCAGLLIKPNGHGPMNRAPQESVLCCNDNNGDDDDYRICMDFFCAQIHLWMYLKSPLFIINNII